MSSPQILAVDQLTVRYRQGRSTQCAVDGISLDLRAGQTLGVVGESGSGKSTLARAIIGLAPIASGRVTIDGRDTTHLRGRARRELAREVQYVFQDPYGSLNPAKTIGQTLAEGLHLHRELSRTERDQRVRDTLELVGMPAACRDRYPGSFSGGQRQRIAIARALLPSPKVIICDEPTASLDLSIQAQILQLLRDLQEEFKLSYLFIAHNLDVVRYMSHRTMVMCNGRVVEEGPAEVIATSPSQPYTQALLDATPVADPEAQAAKRARRRTALERPPRPDADGTTAETDR